MAKLLIIGIDSMDRELVSKYLDSLPNFRKIIEESPKIRSASVFPPDSDTAWASIYTGLNPTKHGIVEFVDPLDPKERPFTITEQLGKAKVSDIRIYENNELYESFIIGDKNSLEDIEGDLETLSRSGAEADEVLVFVSEALQNKESMEYHGSWWGFH